MHERVGDAMTKYKRPQWYIRLDEGEEGPLTSQTLWILVEAGKIHPDSLIRKDGMTKAIPAIKIKGLLKEITQANIAESQVKQEYDTASSNGMASVENVPQVRPWVRYWARLFDLTLFNVLVSLWMFFLIQIRSQHQVVKSYIGW